MELHSRVLPDVHVQLRVFRLPGTQSIHVAVIHGEGSGDQHRIVDFKIGRAALPGVLHVLRSDLLAPLLHLAGNDQQRLQLVRNGRLQEVTLDLVNQPCIRQVSRRGSAMAGLAKETVILAGDV
jgi:hypothetical protein